MLDIDFPSAKLGAADEARLKAARKTAEPEPGPQSQNQKGTPKGELIASRYTGLNFYKGIERDYWTYVPKTYDAGTPANLIVFQDGANYLKRTNAAIVLDNLIAKGDLAPTIALFVEPGDFAGQPHGSRANRSREYDAVNDTYVRFLAEEMLPAATGAYNVTTDPRKRAICGMSSGGICAFNAAWERPDLFGLVISHVGSFTNIMGGHIYPSRVRQNAVRPIRVFMQDGAADLDNDFGHWPTANHDMAIALKYKGYDMRFEFGLGAHDFKHPAAILPETLRWIFRP